MFRSFAPATAALLLVAAGPASAGVFTAPSYAADVTFADQLGSTTMTIAFDGTSYWSSTGGNTGGVRYARYDAAGNPVATYSPGLDFRSVFTAPGGGTVYARPFADDTIYVQTAPGVFAASATLSVPGLTGTGPSGDQSAVVFNSAGTELLAATGGVVYRWDVAGSALPSVTLNGFGALNNEGDYPQHRGVAAAGGYWLTYSEGVLSAWNPATGDRLDTTVLTGAGTSFDSHFSLSYANGRVFVADGPGGTWRGYNVGFVPAAVPEPGSLALAGAGAAGLLGARLRRRAGA